MSTDPHAVAGTSHQPEQPARPAQRPDGRVTRVAIGGSFWTPVYPARDQNPPEDDDGPRLRNGRFPSPATHNASGRTVWDEIITVLRQGNQDMQRRLAAKEEDSEILRRQNRELYYRCQSLEDQRRYAQERHERALSDQRAETSRVQQLLMNAEEVTSRLTDENRRLQDAAREREREPTSSATEVRQLLQVATELERLANDQKVAIKLAQNDVVRVADRLRRSEDECDRLRRSADRLTQDLSESRRESSRTIEGQANVLKLAIRRKDDAERELNDLKLKLNESSKRLRDKRCIRCMDISDALERLEHLQRDYDESLENVCELMDRMHAKDQKIDELERLVEILREQFRTAGIPVEDAQTSIADALTTRTTVGTPPPSTSAGSSWTGRPSESSTSTRLRPAPPDSSEPPRKRRALGPEDDVRPSEALPARPYDDGPPDLVRESVQTQEIIGVVDPSVTQGTTAGASPEIMVIEADQGTATGSTSVEPLGSSAQVGRRPHIRLIGLRVVPSGTQGRSTRPTPTGPPGPLTAADTPGPSVGACLTALIAPQQTRPSLPPRRGQRRPRGTTSSSIASGATVRRRAAPQNNQWRDVQLMPISTNPPVFYVVDERRFVEVYTDPATGEQKTRDADPLALQALVNQRQQASTSQGRALQQQPQASPSTSGPHNRASVARDMALASAIGASPSVVSYASAPQHIARVNPLLPSLDAIVDPQQFAQAMNASTVTIALPTTATGVRMVQSSGTRPPSLANVPLLPQQNQQRRLADAVRGLLEE